MLLIGLLCGFAQVAGTLSTPIDAVAYWRSGTSTNLYPDHWGDPGPGAWLFYPPPVIQVMRLLQPIGWNLFIVLFTTATFLAIWYCARRWSVVLLLVAWLGAIGIVPVAGALLAYAFLGNLQWILAALTIVAIRHPTAWAVELLTKATPAIGWWWFPLRREWSAARRGAIASLVVLGISVSLSPDLWAEFIRFTLSNGSMANPPLPAFEVPFGVRLTMSASLLLWGARRNHAWTVPVAAGWALPALWGWGFLPFWVAASQLVDVTALDALRRLAPARRFRPALKHRPSPAV